MCIRDSLLSDKLKENPTLTFYFRQNCETLPDADSYNVVGEIKGSEFPDEIIVVGGHLDSWDLAEGAHDDGAGCVPVSYTHLDVYKRQFTICTLSHLALAKTMADSLVKYNPDYRVVIGLFDKVNDRDVSSVSAHTIVEINEQQVPDFHNLFNRYTVFELSCLAKPFMASWLYKTYPDVEKLLYFDADMRLFGDVAPIEKDLDNHSIVITPHVVTPITGEGIPHLRSFLNAGLYLSLIHI